MELDLYHPCPCHPDKKIKFCCGKEIASGLSEVLSKHESRQTLAALERLKQLIDEQGPRDCLLLTRSQLELALGKMEDALVTARQFVEKNPADSLGLERLATALAYNRQPEAAFEALQDAMDNLPDNSVPIAFATGFRAVGLSLLVVQENIPAAVAHGIQACRLDETSPSSDELLQMISSAIESSPMTNRSTTIPPLPEGIAEADWHKRYINAGRAQRRGQFRKAGQLLARALEKFPNEPRLLRAAAFAAAQQPDLNATITAHHRAAACSALPTAIRVEHELFAMELETPSSLVSQVRFQWEVRDLDKLLERLLEHPRCRSVPVDNLNFPEEGPRPRAAFMFLDRDKLESIGEDATFDEVPVMISLGFLFGRQTDREARLEFVIAKDDIFESSRTAIKSLLDELVVVNEEEEVVAEVPQLESLVHRRWAFPAGTGKATVNRINDQWLFHMARQLLPDYRLGNRDNKTLRELAADTETQVTAQAVICQFESELAESPSIREWGAEARNAVGLAGIPQLDDPEFLQEVRSSVFLPAFCDFKKLDDQTLVQIFHSTTQANNLNLVKEVANEILARESLKGAEFAPRRVQALTILGSMAESNEEFLGKFQQARTEMRKAGMPVGICLLREFESCMMRGMAERGSALMREIELHHLDEPGVREGLFSIMVQMGAITPDGRPVQRPGRAENSGDKAGGLWTPDGSTAGEGQQAAESRSGLWIPGQ